MHIELMQFSFDGPWICNVKTIEKAIDHLGFVDFGVWLIEHGQAQLLTFGPRPAAWLVEVNKTRTALPSRLVTSYQEIRTVAWSSFSDFGYEELHLVFGFNYPKRDSKEYHYAVLPTEGRNELVEDLRQAGVQEQVIRVHF